ncbi:hypothetical protein V3331_13315 [Gaopeijia maritima]|uniref:hypothetical protein n=1 Tax=Gaopeijia maritima TaxID=3119007 RepID=UPI0032521BCA
MTRSEELVHQLCRRSFLSMWSLPNPRGKDARKELCDVLVVCDPDVIVFSVKEVTYKESPDLSTGMDRWLSRAVKDSIKQIYGAERFLKRVDRVQDRTGADWLYLPPLERRRVHRIAVALGSRGEVPIADGDSGKGFVHVLEENGLLALLGELDTITDFVEYLRKTEAFLENGQLMVAGLENLLGFYLQQGRAYPRDVSLMIVEDDIWSGLKDQEDFVRRKAAEQVSYLWDALIEHILGENEPTLSVGYGHERDPNPRVEQVARIMARESRFARRLLAEAFREFHQGRNIRSRMVGSPSGVTYVYLARPKEWPREARTEELLARMFIARGTYPGATTIVGIATEEFSPGSGFSLDVAVLEKDSWTDEDQAEMDELVRTTGAFASPDWSERNEVEYPPGEEGS